MIQYSEQVEEIIEAIDTDPERDLASHEKIVLDVVEAAAIIESDGLQMIWVGPLDPDVAIKAFDEIGAFEVVDLIQSTQWCSSAADDRGNYSETEENHISEIEEELFVKLEELPDLIDEYLEDQ